MRNASIRKKVLALAGYEFIVFLLFLWIFIVCIIFTEFDYESIIAIVQWELKWILYFTISIATVYKGNIIKNLIMDCQSYTKYRPNETTGGIFVSWRRKEELPTGA